MPQIEIKHRATGAVLFACEAAQARIDAGLALRDALEKAVAARADLFGANLFGANLAGANLFGANLAGADLFGANLAGANLAGARLAGGMAGANLAGANLAGANLAGANLFGANLAGANLAGARLAGGMAGADLFGANLAGADLAGANLADASLAGGLILVGDRPLLYVGPIGSRQQALVVYLTNRGLRIRAGCFFGDREAFAAAIEKTHGENQHGREYRVVLKLIDEHAALWTPAPPAELQQEDA